MEELHNIFYIITSIVEELRNAISIIALFISLLSIYINKMLWHKTNRPIVSAIIQENTNIKIDSTVFDLVVFNSGNRPAIDIFLYAHKNAIDKIFVQQANEKIKESIYEIFSKSSRIQLLINGDQTRTFFSCCSELTNKNVCILEYAETLPIEITYKDLDGNKYRSKLNLYIRDSQGFGGATWKIVSK